MSTCADTGNMGVVVTDTNKRDLTYCPEEDTLIVSDLSIEQVALCSLEGAAALEAEGYGWRYASR